MVTESERTNLHAADVVGRGARHDPPDGRPAVGHVLDGVVAPEDDGHEAVAVAEEGADGHRLGAAGDAGESRAESVHGALFLDELCRKKKKKT